MLLEHGFGNRPGLRGIVGGGLIGDDLDLGMVGEDMVVGVEFVEVRRRGRLALEDGDLPGLARSLAAMVDQRLRLDEANLHPVGADVIVRRIDRLEVDLQHLDARLDGALLKLRVGLEVRIVNDQEVRLLRDRVGYGARAGVRAPVRIANLKGVAKILGLPAHDRRPAFGEVKAHRQRDEENLLALELLVVGVSFGVVVETLSLPPARRP